MTIATTLPLLHKHCCTAVVYQSQAHKCRQSAAKTFVSWQQKRQGESADHMLPAEEKQLLIEAFAPHITVLVVLVQQRPDTTLQCSSAYWHCERGWTMARRVYSNKSGYDLLSQPEDCIASKRFSRPDDAREHTLCSCQQPLAGQSWCLQRRKTAFKCNTRVLKSL